MSSGTIAAIIVSVSVILLVGGAVGGFLITKRVARERDEREARRRELQAQEKADRRKF